MTSITAEDATYPIEPVTRIAEKNVLTFALETPCETAVREFAAKAGDLRKTACVIDEDGRFVGLVTLKDCLTATAGKVAGSLMHKAALTADVDDTAEGVALKISDAKADFVPVLDEDGRIVCGVYADTAHQYLVDAMTEDADRFAGLSGQTSDDYFEHSVWTDFGRRVPWVLGLAVAGLAAGYVVHIYEDALDALVILALYMPMVADTGGNVGTQSASLVTRILTTGKIDFRMAARIMWRETRVSLLMAAALFAFAFLKVVLISNAADVPAGLTLEQIGFAIAVALAAQVISATLIGAVLPLLAIAIRQDPAIISGPALTTIVDLTGLLLYFLITTSMLGLTVVHF